jgi:glycosyltransferase involved in cell wall biosynthesis
MQGLVHIESDISHDELAEWYRAMNLFVLPSRYENYSNAVIEALACGVPFLASDVGGNQRLAETQGGWFFSSGSADALLKVHDSIAKYPAVARERGAFGGEQVRRKYSWQASAKRLEEILQACLDRKMEAACRA